MRALALLLLVLAIAAGLTLAQSSTDFPSADTMLTDAKHKEPKSGVQIGPGSSITIQQGVGTPTAINVLSFGKTGALLAGGKDFGRVVVWDVANGKFLCAADSAQGIVRAVAISPDDRMLASAGEGDQFSLKLWRLPDCKLLKRYESFSASIRSLAFGPDGSWLVLTDNVATAWVIDVATDKPRLTLKDNYSPLLSPDGALLMTVNKTDFTLWNTADWTKQRVMPRVPASAIPLALNPMTDRMLVVSSGAFQILRFSTGDLLTNNPANPLPKFNPSEGGFAAFNVDLPDILFGDSGGRLWAWDSKTGQTCVSQVMYSSGGALSQNGEILAGSKDNSILAQGKPPNGVLIWRTKRLTEKCHFGPH